MKLGDYLERADNGNYVSFGEIADNDPEGAVDLLEHSSVNNTLNRIEVDSAYATTEIYGDDSDPLEPFENIISTILDNQYTAGFESADQTMREINGRYNDDRAQSLAEKKADKNDTITKLADAGIAASGLGFAGSAAIGSVHGMGASTTTGILASGASARYQGARDRSIAEAAEGLERAYGNMEIEIV